MKASRSNPVFTAPGGEAYLWDIHCKKAAIISYRLGGTDGVSVEAGKWAAALESLGVRVVTVAGSGKCDVVIPGLAVDHAAGPVDGPSGPQSGGHSEPSAAISRDLDRALMGCDIAIAENICSLPLNKVAYETVSACLEGMPSIIRHHDLAVQREHLAHFGAPPTSALWRHVTINKLSQAQLSAWGIDSEVIYNHFPTEPTAEAASEAMARFRGLARKALGIELGKTPGGGLRTIVALQPTRAIPRKNVPAAIRFCESLAERAGDGAQVNYWLAGPPEDGYGKELEGLFSDVTIPVLRGDYGMGIGPAYAASDFVIFPSDWEGFGNPAIESACSLKPLVIGDYPVADELRSFGFRWFGLGQVGELLDLVLSEDGSLERLVELNFQIARKHFGIDALPSKLAGLIESLGLTVPRPVSRHGQ